MAPVRHVCTGVSVLAQTFNVMSALRLTVFLAVVKMYTLPAGVFADDISSTEEPQYFDQLYALGVRAYNDQLWYKCAYNLEKAVKEYKNYKRTLTDCRIACKDGGRPSKLDTVPLDFEEFSIFERFLKHADCFRRCKSEAYEFRPGLRLTKQLEETFEKRKPYAYLQFCWYKLDRLKQAASAAYTFYLANPEDEDMRRNIAFYRDKAKVPENEFIDLELVPYKEHYIRALLAYGEEDWGKVAEEIEMSLQHYYVEEERCRVDCEDTVEDTMASQFTGTIANHILQVLECQLGCEGNLSVIYSEPMEHFVSDYYHYLQYAYYKIDKISEAVEATASYLLFHPDDDVVSENKMIFKKKYKYSDEQFIPRKNVREYVERRAKLRQLLDYLKANLMEEHPDLIFVTDEDTLPMDSEQGQSRVPTTDYDAWMDRYERLGLHLIARDTELKRKYRFAADGLLKQEQCEDLLVLMEDVPVDKRGVQMFTLEHARETLLQQDENYEASLRLFMRATEVLRHYTQRYYNLSGSLYFRHTNLVCWHQVPDPDLENDCVPQEFGTCVPEAKIRESELVEDQFSTVTFLSSLDDAEVYFLAENITTDTSLGMKSGRTVGFQSGDRHGLNIPANGRRCSLVITYTTYRSNDEYDYISTIKMLQRVEEIRMASTAIDYSEVMESFARKGVKVTKKGEDLGGGERVLVDGLASEAECSSLKNMVLDLGKVGDGYKWRNTPDSPLTGNELFAGLTLVHVSQSGALVGDGYDHLEAKPSYISPHTEHEMFQGLTIYRAAKLMHMGLINIFSMKTFLELSEQSRLYVEKYFNLSRPLYFDFTHLVCRSAIDASKLRDDLSHPVHADNCVIQPNGTCLKEYPAFIQRDYSAILYLNDDFEGGEFFFAHPNKTEQVSVRPKCGRLVGFHAGNYHGVKAVQSGVRCALALWFTLNPNFKELAHIHARKVLRTIEKEREAEEKLAHQKSAAAQTAENDENSEQSETSPHPGSEGDKVSTDQDESNDGIKVDSDEQNEKERTDVDKESKLREDEEETERDPFEDMEKEFDDAHGEIADDEDDDIDDDDADDEKDEL